MDRGPPSSLFESHRKAWSQGCSFPYPSPYGCQSGWPHQKPNREPLAGSSEIVDLLRTLEPQTNLTFFSPPLFPFFFLPKKKYRTDLEQLKKNMNEKKSARKKRAKNPSNYNVSSSVKMVAPPATPATPTTTTTFVSYIPEITPSPTSTLDAHHQQQASTALDRNSNTQMSPSTTLATTVLTTPEPSYGREILDKSFYYSVPVLDFENDEICRLAFEELISTIMEGQPLWQPPASLEVDTSYVAPSHVL